MQCQIQRRGLAWWVDQSQTVASLWRNKHTKTNLNSTFYFLASYIVMFFDAENNCSPKMGYTSGRGVIISKDNLCASYELNKYQNHKILRF